MTTDEKTILHYKVIAYQAHKIEKVAKELVALYNNSVLDTRKVEVRNRALRHYIKELSQKI